MRFRRRDVLKVVTSSAAAAAATKLGNARAMAASSETIVRDVCVLGGGSAGTYTAVRLGDLGKSVVVLEKKGRLGGHAETVTVDNVPINIGVEIFENTPLITNYAARFGVPLLPIDITVGGPTQYADFRTGKAVSYTPPGPAAFGPALFEYLTLLQTNFPYLDNGFQLPNPVPADLLIPFGDFVTKYGLDALVPTAFLFAQGSGNLLQHPALYALKLFGLSVAGSLAQNAFAIIPAGTASLYDAAAKYLGNDAIVNATVLGAIHSKDGIDVYAETPGGIVHVRCKKLVVAFPPTLENLAPLGLDLADIELFSHFRPNLYAAALVKLTGLPAGLTVQNVAAGTRDNLPPLAGCYEIRPAPVPGFAKIEYGGPNALPDDVIKANIVADIERLKATYPDLKFGGFQAFTNHTPFQMMVSSEEIADGFYARLNALQGRQNTFFNGAAFQTNDSSLIWEFTEGLLPQIVA
jgi:hypothetical protein